MSKFVKFFSELRIKDVPQVGGKNASLGEMYSKLTKKKIRVPNGFAITADAYRYFMDETGLKKQIKEILKDLNTKDVTNLMAHGKAVRNAIMRAELPAALDREIFSAYHKLCQSEGRPILDVAVRSSATAEDLPDASFAGQQESFLNIRGDAHLLLAVKECIASLFTNRAISYRHDKGFDHFKIALSVGVQRMIRSDIGSSGVMFTIDTESGFKNTVLIHSIYGLGENIVQGRVNPDEFYVFKPTGAIISRALGKKDLRLIYDADRNHPTKNISVPISERNKFSLDDANVKLLAKWGMEIEKHYRKAMDIEWAFDGHEQKLYIIQARPETVESVKDPNLIEKYELVKSGEVFVQGQSVGNKIGAGVVNKILNVSGIRTFKPGQVLVTDMTDPDWEPIMKIASAIVTDKGGRTCHAAIVSRELGIPCVVGTNNATRKLSSGMKITVNCAEGEHGYVYKGILPFKVTRRNVKNLKRPKTKIMMNVAEPDLAFQTSFIPNDGIGLARLEFIINNSLKIHPLALLNFNKQTPEVKTQIEKITFPYKDKRQFFIDKMAEGVAMIAASVYPKDCIVRLSDFKTNEYANLIGGKEYEPVESNPMIGWRGANRYYTPRFVPAFDMECEAMKKVRDEMGLTNLKIMIPFCRTVEEGQRVKAIMARHGLIQGKNGLQIYVMAEIPANIILAEKFAAEFDGFSIGSNDLTQLTLGIDRDSGAMLGVAGVSNEKNEAVKILIKRLIEVGHKTKTKVGICGQAPSDYPDFVEFLVKLGIDSISLIPDTVIDTTINVLKVEKRAKR
ncbi:MAG TPA: phosphoenolpyruvate synthase [Candidatus Nanoarchaeia archaeon]|nr:phosphoenolpyruvate synthase [Candidatus Nanoarchaeia archaeon]